MNVCYVEAVESAHSISAATRIAGAGYENCDWVSESPHHLWSPDLEDFHGCGWVRHALGPLPKLCVSA